MIIESTAAAAIRKRRYTFWSIYMKETPKCSALLLVNRNVNDGNKAPRAYTNSNEIQYSYKSIFIAQNKNDVFSDSQPYYLSCNFLFLLLT